MHQQSREQSLVSVIIPAYNAQDFIGATLQSVLMQTYKMIEVLVVDDGSTDRTVEIVQEFAKDDRRIILLRQQNAGVAAARNLAIQAAKGEFIAPVDADDIWYPQKLEKQVQVMLQSDESVALVYAWSVYINEDGSLTTTCQINNVSGEMFVPLLHGNLLGNASSALIRRICFEKVGGYNTKLKQQNAQGCEDWDIYLRIAEHYQFQVVPELLIGYRQVLGSMSFDCEKMLRSFELVAATAQQQHPEIPAKAFRWARSNFNWYLAMRCKQVNNHWKTAHYLLQSARLDYFPLIRVRFHLMLFRSLIQLLVRPILTLLHPGDSMQPLPPRTSLTLSELNQIQTKKHQRFPRKQYADFLQYRWRSIRSEISASLHQEDNVNQNLSSTPR